MAKFKVVHYLNQFFGQIGGEEKADYPPEKRDGVVGPGMAFRGALGDECEIVSTIICGDTYFNEHTEEATAQILAWVKEEDPDLFIAGPAFNAGRYGVACGGIASAVKNELGIPAITGMYEENPGADMYKSEVYILKTRNSAAGMRKAVPAMSKLALKILKGEEIASAAEEGYIPTGVRTNYFASKRGSARAIDMLIKKLAGEKFVTEYPMPTFDHVDPAPALKDLAHANIALVTSGGIVPKGNPDRIESSSASKFGEYSIAEYADLTEADHETAHGGFDPVYANEDSDRVLPVDVMRDLEKEGVIGKLNDFFYTTTGNGTAVASAKKFGEEIAKRLKEQNVDAVILTSTWGTCTRCGATMLKEIERAGFPIVHVCTITPISKTVGANRIVPAIAIPHPLGDPGLDKDEEYKLRRKIVERALEALQIEVEDQTIFEVE